MSSHYNASSSLSNLCTVAIESHLETLWDEAGLQGFGFEVRINTRKAIVAVGEDGVIELTVCAVISHDLGFELKH